MRFVTIFTGSIDCQTIAWEHIVIQRDIYILVPPEKYKGKKIT